jgi:hypothetical protein
LAKKSSKFAKGLHCKPFMLQDDTCNIMHTAQL